MRFRDPHGVLGKFWLDSPTGVHTVVVTSHGKSQKEASSEDEQAQAPEALEVESPQEAHVAEVGWRGSRRP